MAKSSTRKVTAAATQAGLTIAEVVGAYAADFRYEDMPESIRERARYLMLDAIGIAFASLLPVLCGVAWFRNPALLPALAVGIGTVLAPFLLMQPGMGAGIAASRTPRPAVARMHSLVTHAMFGVGLYVVARLIGMVA